MSTKDMAELFGVTGVSTISNWRARHADFPRPVIGGHNAQFDVDEVLAWARRPDTPARLTVAPSPEWWWAKTVDAVRTVADVQPGRTTADPVEGYLVAVVLARAVFAGELPGATSRRREWAKVLAAGDPAAELATAANRMETSHSMLSGLLVDPLGFIRVPAVELGALLVRLDAAATAGVSARRLFEIVIEQTSTAVHPKTTSSTTDQQLADLIAGIARPTPGETLYDPCAGEGRLLVACARAAHGAVRVVGQELEADASRIARTRFLLEPLTVELGRPGLSSIGEDQYPGLRADLVVVDPPVSTKLPIGDWVEHALDHLAGNGRCVITLPAYAITDIDEARRKPQQDLRDGLTVLAGEGRITAITIVSHVLRREVTGPLTIWELTNRAAPGRKIELGRLDNSEPGDLAEVQVTEVAADQLLDALAAATRDQPKRGSRRRSPRLRSGASDGATPGPGGSQHQQSEGLLHAIEAVTLELSALAFQVSGEHSNDVHRILDHVRSIAAELTTYSLAEASSVPKVDATRPE